jgi:hypothetical protein
MTRVVNPFLQYFDDEGNVLSGGKVYTYEPSTTTNKATYSDDALSVPNANPIVLGADGRPANAIFLSGAYRFIIKDSNDVQIDDQDDVNSGSAGNFADWDSGATYNIPDVVVGSDTKYYQSITNSNSGNNPTSSATNWQEVQFIAIWNTNASYDTGELAVASDGLLYSSLTDSNQGNDPTSSSANWGPVSTIDTPQNNVLTSYVGLKCERASSTTVDVDATSVILKDTSGNTYQADNVNLTMDITTSGANGLDTGSEANSTWYNLWVIWNGSTVAGLLSTSATSPTMPSGYTHKGLVGAILNNSSGNFEDMLQMGDTVATDYIQVLGSGGATTRTSVDLSAAVPPIATGVVGMTQINAGETLTIYSNDSNTYYMARHNNGAAFTETDYGFHGIIEDAQTLYYMVSSGGSAFIRITGWRYG